MTRRIVSGVFLLIALGVLGVILAGALTSGEQLIVRFLTAIIVAALALYVISDLRLQAGDDAAAAGSRTTTQAPRITAAPADPPPNSTAAFMATVTGRRDRADTGPISADDFADNAESLLHDAENGGHDRIPAEQMSTAAAIRQANAHADPESAELVDDSDGLDAERDRAADRAPDRAPDRATAERVGAAGPSPYESETDEAWPFNDAQEQADLNAEELPDLGEIDDLVAMFTRQTEQELEERRRSLQLTAAGAGSAASGGHLDTTSPAPRGPQGGLPPLPPRETSDFLTPVDRADDDEGPQGEAAADQDASDDVVSVPPFLETTESAVETLTVRGESATENESPIADVADADSGNLTASSDGSTPSDSEVDVVRAMDEVPTAAVQPPPPAPSVNPRDLPTPSAAPNLPPAPEIAAAPLAGRGDASAAMAADYADEAIAPIIDLRPATGAGADGINAAIRSGEIEVISSLIDQGLLSTDGPISDRDVRTMVYVAFTSSELRKILLAGGTVDGDNSGLELGDVEVFSSAQPAADPAALPAAQPPQGEAPATVHPRFVQDHGHHVPNSQAL